VRIPILLGLACLPPLAGWAADVAPMDVKLGLWETTVTSQMSGMPSIPAEALAKLTPEQRAKMEAGMQGRGGGSSRTTTAKHCVTKETLNGPLAFVNDKDQNCKRTVVSSTGAKQDIHMECTSGGIQTSSDLHVEKVDREAIKGSMVTSTGGSGRGISVKMEFYSKWLAEDCGDVGSKKN